MNTKYIKYIISAKQYIFKDNALKLRFYIIIYNALNLNIKNI